MANNATRYNSPSLVPLRSMMDQLFTDSFFAPPSSPWPNGTGIAANILETGESYIVQVAVPGVDQNSLDVRALGPQLRIEGSYSQQQTGNAKPQLQGLPTGDFRTVTLPCEVVGDGADASRKDGISCTEGNKNPPDLSGGFDLLVTGLEVRFSLD